jgi:hypothetical protein
MSWVYKGQYKWFVLLDRYLFLFLQSLPWLPNIDWPYTRSNILHQIVWCYYCYWRFYRCLIYSLSVISMHTGLSLSLHSKETNQLDIVIWILQTYRHAQSMFIRKQSNSSYKLRAKGRGNICINLTINYA